MQKTLADQSNLLIYPYLNIFNFCITIIYYTYWPMNVKAWELLTSSAIHLETGMNNIRCDVGFLLSFKACKQDDLFA